MFFLQKIHFLIYYKLSFSQILTKSISQTKIYKIFFNVELHKSSIIIFVCFELIFNLFIQFQLILTLISTPFLPHF